MKNVYLAIPYTGMEQSSYEQSLDTVVLLTQLFKGEINVFSPIVHSHPLTHLGLKGDWEFWKKIDYQFLDWCDEVFVLVPREGSDKVFESVGVMAELEYAKQKGKKIKYIKKKSAHEVAEIEFKKLKISD